MGAKNGAGERWLLGVVCLESGISGVDDGFIAGGHASVPAAVTLFLLDAGVVSGLVAGIAEVGQHVRPEALVLRSHKAGQVVAGLNLPTEKNN